MKNVITNSAKKLQFLLLKNLQKILHHSEVYESSLVLKLKQNHALLTTLLRNFTLNVTKTNWQLWYSLLMIIYIFDTFQDQNESGNDNL